jgi:hypothetical protein
MKFTKLSLTVITILFPVSLSIGKLSAHDAGLTSLAFEAAQTAKAKQQCISYCRARYRDCRHFDQLPSFECQGVYQDCARYSCTGLGPG